ncbi:hypothetical protein, partial [Pseudomonas viridiflava]|uniref:hypothetical protein n=1 Tax=Pseudomonas viridiflava TaxID=33069 RepID=UPI00106F4B88
SQQGGLTAPHNGLRRQHRAIRQGERVYLHWDGELRLIEPYDPISTAGASHSGKNYNFGGFLQEYLSADVCTLSPEDEAAFLVAWAADAAFMKR